MEEKHTHSLTSQNTDYILSQNQHKQPKIKISRETIFRANYGHRRKQWRVEVTHH